MRNRLLHFDPRRKRFEGVPEIGSAKAFRELARRGHHAYTGLVGPLLPFFESAAEEP